MSSEEKSKTPQPKRRFRIFPKKLGEFTEAATKDIFKAHGFAHARILTEWPDIVGSELAAHCIPLKLSKPKSKKDGVTLTVQAYGSHAMKLDYQRPQIMEKIATYFGYRAVKEIKIIQRPMEK